MNISGTIFQFFRLPKEPTIMGYINGREIELKFKDLDCKVGDSKYKLITNNDMYNIIKLNRFNEMTYTPEYRDCDDYSYAMMGLVRSVMGGVAFGIVWTDVMKPDGTLDYKHSLNFFFNDKKEFMLVEPQTNQIYNMPKNYKPFFVLI